MPLSRLPEIAMVLGKAKATFSFLSVFIGSLDGFA
jgi:hypothetical protein